ncbi:MAG: tubulin-like doman-containing protein, partial [Planctomycetota bacterium]
MAKPALLIGLGGTGQWVLTYVKKELLDYTQGEGVPPEVKLVSFDTTRAIAGKSEAANSEHSPAIDGVQLEPGEFFHLGGSIEHYVRDIVERRSHPHIASWLQAKTYLNHLGPGDYLLEDGAGQRRPFGRMAVFKDLESNDQNSTIFGTLRDAIDSIRAKILDDRPVEISIIASLAGGTGAGMA